jgi:hypothetical protein
VVAGPDDVVAIDRDFERRQLGVAADLRRDELVDGRPGFNIGALGLLRVGAAHERWRRARVLAADVALICGLEVVQPGEDRQTVAVRLDWLQTRRDLEALPLGEGRPVGHVRAVAAVDRGKARRRFRLSPQRRHHGVEKRQGDCCADATYERAPWQR